MKAKFMNFLGRLSRDEMSTIMGGYEDNPLWGGSRFYDCECTGGSNNGDGFHAYMETSSDYMSVQSAQCNSGHMTCSY